MPMLNHKNAISVFFEFAAGIHGRAARRFLYRLVKQPCNQSRRLGSIECRSSSQSVRSSPRIPAERPSLHSCRDLQKPGSRPLQRMAVSLSFAPNDSALIKKQAPLWDAYILKRTITNVKYLCCILINAQSAFLI